jgi:hypothetical protein
LGILENGKKGQLHVPNMNQISTSLEKLVKKSGGFVLLFRQLVVYKTDACKETARIG